MKALTGLGCVALAASLAGCGGGGGGWGGFAGLPLAAVPAPSSDVAATPAPAPAPAVAGGSGTPATAPATGTPPPPPPAPGAGPGVVYTYKAAPGAFFGPSPATVALATLSSPAFVGYSYARPSMDGAQMIMMKGVETYTHRVGTSEVAMSLQGFTNAGSWPDGPQLYSKPSSDNGVVYDYTPFSIGSPSAPTPSAEVLAKLNANGQSGFCQLGGGTGEEIGMRRRNAAPLSRCTFEILPLAWESTQAYVDQLNLQGARGFVLLFTGYGIAYWRKDEAQEATYDYALVDKPTDDQGLLAQLNDQGARGAIEWVSVAKTPGKSIYQRTTNCTRPWLCGPY